MIFPGIKNEKEAGDLWAYLTSIRRGRQEEVGFRPHLILVKAATWTASIITPSAN